MTTSDGQQMQSTVQGEVKGSVLTESNLLGCLARWELGLPV